MFQDCRGLEITAASEDAVKAFDATIVSYLGINPNAGPNLKATLDADPDMPLAHALKTYFFMLMATGPLQIRAQKAAADARKLAENANPRERMHIDAAEHWANGRKRAAIAMWEAILVGNPLDALALRLAHHGHFYEGDGQNLRDTVTRRLYAWSPDVPGYGYVKGMQSFGYEETHNYDAAIKAGEEAVDIISENPWAIHAVAHVYEMRDLPDAGIAWIKKNQPGWITANNFRYHVWWHRMLMHLDRAEYDDVFRLYDEDLWDPESDEYLDLINDAAVLLRLELHDQDVGARWEALAEKCKLHKTDQALAFIDVHHAISLSAVDGDDAQDLLDAMQAYATTKGDDNAYVTQMLGLPLAHALVAHRHGDYGYVVDTLLPIRYELHKLGGSHAQRDLFSMVLIDAALKSNRINVARMLISERLGRLPDNKWTRDKAAAAERAI
ncbi:tetratricopeptide repeat protein [Thalassospiraceae bacterium LMO-JJ14]|nr:tetratricopeptide repeat protein [Thalassospiraceae bacterium LMO-JJ14]